MTSFPNSAHHDVSRSLDLYEQAGELIPGWTQLISRRATSSRTAPAPFTPSAPKVLASSMLTRMNTSTG